MVTALNMVILYNEGCPATPKAIKLIEECISESGIPVDMRKILVTSREEAERWKFLGSPTVQINGIDIDPGARGAKVFGFMWRTYGASVMPSKEMILNAMKEALNDTGWQPAAGEGSQQKYYDTPGDSVVKRFTPVDPDYEKRVRSSFGKQEIMRTIRADLVKVAPGEAVIEFAYDASLIQQHGYIHAGIVTTVVDSACGYAAYTLMPPDSEVLTIEYKVNFMSPAIGERFKGIGKVLRPGRTVTVCSGDMIAIENGKEKVVATMLATMISVSR